MSPILIVPGLNNSGPGHWQTWLENLLPGTLRVEQRDWTQTCLAEWAENVRKTIDASADKVWIIAHSFGCLATVAASGVRAERIHGALLAAPADPAHFSESTASLETRLTFPSLVVASNNDPWIDANVAHDWAERWGSRYINIGAAGHINIESGYGPWPEGLRLFEALRTGRAG